MTTRRNRPLIIFLLLLALVVALAATTIYFYQRSRKTVTSTEEETTALIAEVGERMYLPADEEPTIATVTEPEKLQGQTFFVDAKRGYKVLIYTNAKKAILYDPVAGKIVNMAPITIGTNTPGTVTE